MNMNGQIYPLRDHAALFMDHERMLIIADLHIGIEYDLRKRGINTRALTDKLLKEVISLIKKSGSRKLLILGDLKHIVPSMPHSQMKDVKLFLEKLSEIVEIHLIPGNHDGGIERILTNDIILHESDGYTVGDIGFTHGHRWPSSKIMECKRLVIAHTHPTIMLRDGFGYRYFERCWVVAKVNKDKVNERYPNSNVRSILIMPAFNSLSGGTAINKEGILGPFGKIIELNSSQIYLLDGSALGNLEDIK